MQEYSTKHPPSYIFEKNVIPLYIDQTMRFPCYESFDAPHEDLLLAYARFHSEYERDHSEYTKKYGGRETSNLIAIAKHVGNGCFRLGKGDHKGARRQFEVAAPALRKTTQELSTKQRGRYTQALLLGHTLSMLRHRNQPQTVERERKAMHGTVVSELQYYLKQGNHFLRSPKKPTPSQTAAQSKRVGTINELTSLGLVTRYAHPWALAMPALLHHDQNEGDTTESYDNILVEALPGRDALFYRLQLKSECIGACKGNLQENTKGPQGQKRRYVSDIRLISGHCDLAYDRKNPVDNSYFPLGTLLVREAVGRPSAEDIETLDMASNQLLFTATSDDSRRGTAVY